MGCFFASSCHLPVLTIFLALVSVWQVNQLTQQSSRVDHADRVIGESRRFLEILIDEETGVRGYVASSEKLFLERYDSAPKATELQISKLK